MSSSWQAAAFEITFTRLRSVIGPSYGAAS
jgi:hypothetical protein